MDQARHPVTSLAGRYGHPIHPALVAVPIGAWVGSFAFDLASRFVSEPQGLTDGARWLIGLGVIGALTAALAGFLDLFAIPTGTPAFRKALAHMAINLAVTGAYAANFALRGADPPGPVAVGPLALSAISLAGLTVAGYLGGELVYRYGVRVADETTQAQGYNSTDKENS
ncbi:Uncharacterized membrane protein [Micromonospora coriariae]|uniref:Uncharacterized membrane protein n=1 Tax=Micromonospora coriariae TaxID=285665 RepID=A0A1C4Y853_9ACTN|nr:DUF2231 domain-containing protein [Micromonospora coriariae]SCF16816.1 Uncharacterized membrane protein [Micromonospora coriariae]